MDLEELRSEVRGQAAVLRMKADEFEAETLEKIDAFEKSELLRVMTNLSNRLERVEKKVDSLNEKEED